jgi:hypothetical protein
VASPALQHSTWRSTSSSGEPDALAVGPALHAQPSVRHIIWEWMWGETGRNSQHIRGQCARPLHPDRAPAAIGAGTEISRTTPQKTVRLSHHQAAAQGIPPREERVQNPGVPNIPRPVQRAISRSGVQASPVSLRRGPPFLIWRNRRGLDFDFRRGDGKCPQVWLWAQVWKSGDVTGHGLRL